MGWQDLRSHVLTMALQVVICFGLLALLCLGSANPMVCFPRDPEGRSPAKDAVPKAHIQEMLQRRFTVVVSFGIVRTRRKTAKSTSKNVRSYWNGNWEGLQYLAVDGRSPIPGHCFMAWGGVVDSPAIFAGLLATNAWNWLVMKKHLWFRIIRIEEQSFKYPRVN